MFGSTILDVAIGMCLIYLLFSLICSAISELIEGFAKNRAADLERGIRELLSHQSGDQAVQKFYDHPLIYSLFAGDFQSAALKKWWQKGRSLPSYIPARNFALALMDLALPGSGTQASGAAGSTPASVTPTQTGVVINNTLTPSAASPQPTTVNGGNSIEQLRNAVVASTILNAKTKQALITLLDAAGTDVSRARENIENWYNSAMDRVSGWYKRRTQAIVAIVALIAAAGVNVDSVTLVNTISTDQSVRDSLISVAQEQAKHGGIPQENQYTSGTQGCADPKSPDCRITASIAQLKALGIPIGWTNEPFGTEPSRHSVRFRRLAPQNRRMASDSFCCLSRRAILVRYVEQVHRGPFNC